MTETKRFPIYRGIIKCPNCGNMPDYGKDSIKEDIQCLHCRNIFSYDDGFIEFLADLDIRPLLSIPLYAGVLEVGNWKIRVGKATKIQFKTPFYEIYRVSFPRPTDTDEKLFEQTILKPVEVNTDGFVVISSSLNESIINQEIEIGYEVQGRDFLENVPIWHRFLQSAFDSLRAQRYGMAIVESISTFDAFFDEFLMNQLKKKRGYSSKTVRQIAETYDRRDKLHYLLFYVTGKTFEDSPFDGDLKAVADLRNKIVHPKEYKFKESDLTWKNAEDALRTVVKSIKWVNDTKRIP
jgi:hypothetical protein